MSNALTDKSHKRLSASSTERWWNCPGSITLSEQAPRQVPSKYAAEGTYAHMMAELDLKLRLGRITDGELRAWNIAQQGYDIDGFRFSWNEELRAAVEEWTEYILDIKERYRVSGEQIRSETSFTIPGNSELGGTADCVIYIPYRRLIVLDFKYGAGSKVEAYDNKQLLTYALGAFMELDPDEREETPIIEMVIVQPRMVPSILTHTISNRELLAFQVELLAAADRTVTENGRYQAGTWCKYCPAQIYCPARKKFEQEKIGVDFAMVPITPNFLTYSGERIAEILEAIPVVENFIKDFKSFAIGEGLRGVEIPGYEVKESLGNRKWTTDETGHIEFLNTANKQLGLLTDTELFTRDLRSPSQLEKIAKTKKAKLDLSPYTVREVTGSTLAKLKNGELARRQKDAFAAIEVEEIG